MIQRSTETEHQPSHNEHDDEEDDEDNQMQQDMVQSPSTPHATPARPLGKFMTPQVSRVSNPNARPRSSMGAATIAGPRRVRLVEPWKVSDLVVPMGSIKDEEDEEIDVPEHSISPEKTRSGASEKKITEEERQVNIFLKSIAQNSRCCDLVYMRWD